LSSISKKTVKDPKSIDTRKIEGKGEAVMAFGKSVNERFTIFGGKSKLVSTDFEKIAITKRVEKIIVMYNSLSCPNIERRNPIRETIETEVTGMTQIPGELRRLESFDNKSGNSIEKNT
tara:strand:- start:285 stop:641 length:357 start_codon:yes stop_codon:yes gene_type:complete